MYCVLKKVAPLDIADCNVFFEPKLSASEQAAARCAVAVNLLYSKKYRKAGQTLENEYLRAHY